MAPPLWSKQGCWTCRLRKKKCDEGHPQCSTCESLSIPCHGYGPKPDWMDGGDDERAVANSIKEVVKHTSRRKAANSAKQRDPAKIAPKSAPVTESSASPIEIEDSDIPNPASSADESALLMHFLDHVFSLQFPVYRPSIQDGGRGWLLSALLQTKSLYHGALALSAYHRRTAASAVLSQPSQIASLVQQEKHLETCIKSLNMFTQTSCPNSELGTITAILQLAFFEVFTNYGNAWQAHLRAAMNMYQRCSNNDSAYLSLANRSRGVLNEGRPLLEHETAVSNETAQFTLISGAMIWLDIISCLTAPSAPQLLSYHSTVLASDSQTRLENIMGCENWVMLQIGRIAALQEQKVQALQQEHFNCGGFGQSVADINKELQCGLDASELDFAGKCNPAIRITRVFASMASVYLHLITNGFQQLDVLDSVISRVMIMLQTEIPSALLSPLVAPLYVIGSAARQEDEQFFRDAFSSPPLLDTSLKQRTRILPILEEIWKKRRTEPSFMWEDSQNLVQGILLI
ncbi:hypothetical protein O988_01257 [Pseudogymnoascus sp. VKM F-3808]|nr:hypothetical protein O988_01257 [Pseudogymnoascus sp. VKM F-3808]